ncbi:ribosomal-protein-alanine acetyltransferase [Bartonella henselae]|uniref:Peptide N-acetyltransferase n=1 Tax=Bartonella henselae (strain ATCC 49882 / DSM 28221 / CCUG 30454 / Houston 1) TaxID=283166 RepID=A0A0H3M4J4_BARHE|nr:ribosomal protein S18-alanine N-acetyltransferase [Bartonella henselae]ATP11862.1 ribosomal-protein-alanine N-acetyltransferase [Bartonella henselae]MDM9990455.1 ribosomal protein S18-alanine N-acetyltransferase [Bartonella henselae]OLL40831.1 ribosomal-protein-alanine acetyltransferase [Bartonella henselae]OLL43171.1 ribosomal-protein-alanine acetyltransferase [Bartonella henselae]OLL43887.1 ribosomal-protein-alanine acetyltransferase [Bartonella henselae]
MSKLLSKKKHFWIAPLKADDSVPLYQIHQHCFVPAWEKKTFDHFLTDQSIFGYKASLIGRPDEILGFCLCRLILDEAEIITIAVHPHCRRQGIGTLLIDSTLRHLHHERALKLFLEVEETNLSALSLYKGFEFQKIAKRFAYYQSKNSRTDAIIMQKTFKQID